MDVTETLTQAYNQLGIYYILVTLLLFFLFFQIQRILDRRNRFKLATIQAQNYWFKLRQETKTKEETLKRELANLLADVEQLEEKLDRECPSHEQSHSRYGHLEVDELQAQIKYLKEQQRQLKDLDRDILEIENKVNDLSSGNSYRSRHESESENQKLRATLDKYKSYALEPEDSELDQNILAQLRDDKFTIEYLFGKYNALLKVKAENPDQAVSDVIKPMDYAAERTKLEVILMKNDEKLKQTKQQHIEEFNEFKDVRIEYMFKITSARVLLTRLKEKNDIAQQIIQCSPVNGSHLPPVPVVDEDAL